MASLCRNKCVVRDLGLFFTLIVYRRMHDKRPLWLYNVNMEESYSIILNRPPKVSHLKPELEDSKSNKGTLYKVRLIKLGERANVFERAVLVFDKARMFMFAKRGHCDIVWYVESYTGLALNSISKINSLGRDD